MGALDVSAVTVAVRLTATSPNADSLRVLATTAGGTEVLSSPVAAGSRVAKIPISGLSANTTYTYRIVSDKGHVSGPSGTFTTLPVAAGTACNFTFALSGDAQSGSNHVSFASVLAKAPLFFLHLGDLHYDNINVNTQSIYQAGFDNVFASPRQAALFRNVPTVYVWDDHDYGPNNADGTSPGHDAACAVFRNRVPHYPLADATVTAHVGHSFTVGRVLFIVTDQRSGASPDANTDNSSKTMLGSSQKAWFKTQIDTGAASGKLIVWVCPRIFGGTISAGADDWGGFTTERAELCDYIHAHAPGRVVVLSADGHYLAIDDGSHHNFVTSGSEPLPTFQCAPLDQSTGVFARCTYSQGAAFTGVGQFGTMQVTDSGGSSIGITWKGFDSAGTQLISYSFSVNV